MKVGVFTVGLPDLTPEEAVRELKDASYDGVEGRGALFLGKQPLHPGAHGRGGPSGAPHLGGGGTGGTWAWHLRCRRRPGGCGRGNAFRRDGGRAPGKGGSRRP